MQRYTPHAAAASSVDVNAGSAPFTTPKCSFPSASLDRFLFSLEKAGQRRDLSISYHACFYRNLCVVQLGFLRGRRDSKQGRPRRAWCRGVSILLALATTRALALVSCQVKSTRRLRQAEAMVCRRRTRGLGAMNYHAESYVNGPRTEMKRQGRLADHNC